MSQFRERQVSSGTKIKRDIRTPKSAADSGLTFLPPEDGISRDNSVISGRSSSSRASNGSFTRTPRRTPTPTKQISLKAARRKEEQPEIEENGFDWAEHERLESARLFSRGDSKNAHNDTNDITDTYKQSSHTSNTKSSSHSYRSAAAAPDSAAEEMLKKCYKRTDVSDMLEQMNFSDPKLDSSTAGDSKVDTNGAGNSDRSRLDSTEQGAVGGVSVNKGSNDKSGGDIDNSDEFDTDLEDNGSASETEETKEPRKAPNELFMEFLDCIMKEEWKPAKNLCRMILIYEPDHKEAKDFQPIIDEKISEEEEAENASTSEEDSDDESSDENSDSEQSAEDSDESGEEEQDGDESAPAENDDAS